MFNRERVQERVREHYNFVCNIYGEKQVLGVFLYGSQNYDLATDESDVDTKAIYVPTLPELAFEKPLSIELHLPNGEHCEVKDIREMIANFKKQNINFLEILYTDFFVINPVYKELWKELKSFREEICFYDPAKAILSSAHQAKHTLEQARTSKDFRKKLSNVYRIIYYLDKYVQNKPFLTCICPKGAVHEHLRYLKYKNYEQDEKQFERYEKYLKAYIELGVSFKKRQEQQSLYLTQKESLDKRMNEIALKMIKLIF